jgi:hypothetical protein
VHVEFWRGISLEKDNLQDRDEGGRIILKLVLAILMIFFLFAFVVLNFTCYFCCLNFVVFFVLFCLSLIVSVVIPEPIFYTTHFLRMF